MSSPWAKIVNPVETMNFAEIMSEEYALRVRDQEIKKLEKLCGEGDCKKGSSIIIPSVEKFTNQNVSGDDLPNVDSSSSYAEISKKPNQNDSEEWEDYSELINDADVGKGSDSATKADETHERVCDSDELIALMLQSQFDREYNEELERIEKQQNKDSKVSISLDKYRRNGDLELMSDQDDDDDDDDETISQKRDWDRFETNAKRLDTIPKCGFKVDKSNGEMITKHDEELCGVRNACRLMAFPTYFPTGDGAGFEMKLSNQVFNQLKSFSRSNIKKNKMSDRQENVATAELGVDAPTRLLLYKLINNRILEQINGIISTGKEAVILHANSDPNYAASDNSTDSNHRGGALLPPHLMPKECAIKIFKTTLNEFKQRDRYIKDDYRFKERFSKQNNRVIINMWAEKEMHNIMRMQAVGINCPNVIVLKRHVLVMSFIGDNHNAAPKLKDVHLNFAELTKAYREIVESMHKLYNVAKLIHADLSEYNILWYDGKCWFIDVAQSVEPNHPSALEFLMRDCANIINFFAKRGLPDIFTKQQLFEYITGLAAESHNAAMLERIHTRGASINEATVPNQDECPDELKPISYPFDLAWEKSQADKEKIKVDNAAAGFSVLCVQNEEDESETCVNENFEKNQKAIKSLEN